MVTSAPGHSKETVNLSFGQREGAFPIPKPLQLGEASPELRAALWAVTYEDIRQCAGRDFVGQPTIGNPWREILLLRHVRILHRPVDEFAHDLEYHVSELKELFFHGTYVDIFEFLEFVMQSNELPREFAEDVALVLRETQAAYFVVDYKFIFPASTVEEVKTLEDAFENLRDDSYAGARSHLLNAGEELNQGNYANSVRESIHAIESISRALVPDANSLNPALTALEGGGQLHNALKKGFSALYGFTSDEQGIRHALLDKAEAEVDRECAVFMLGACASFLSYLASKGRQAGLIE